jgi:Holliday junction resolvase RusA-like endonuclease
LKGGGMIEFFVPGEAKPAGSKKGFFNKKMQRVQIVDACKLTKPWQAQVSSYAQEAVLKQGLAEPMTGPIAVEFVFTMRRIKGHYRTGKNANVLRDDAPYWHTVMPDALKLGRAVEDAMTGIVFRDDAQIARETLLKRYGAQPGVTVRAWELAADANADRDVLESVGAVLFGSSE